MTGFLAYANKCFLKAQLSPLKSFLCLKYFIKPAAFSLKNTTCCSAPKSASVRKGANVKTDLQDLGLDKKVAKSETYFISEWDQSSNVLKICPVISP